MAGILIIAHTPFARAIGACVEHIYGHRLERIKTIDIKPDVNEKECLHLLRCSIDQVCGKNGTLILSDLANATPSNLATKLGRSSLVRIVSGVNLPLLLKAISYRTSPLDELVASVVSGGVEGIRLLDACDD